MSVNYAGEQFKIEIDFSDITGLDNYITTTYTYSDGSYIESLNFHFTDGDRSNMPIGKIMSSYVYVNIFDPSDVLNPKNQDSAYYGHLNSGRKITIYKSKIVNNIAVWQEYFSGTVSKWSSSYQDGRHGLTRLYCEDILNKICAKDISDLSYSGLNAHNAVTSIFEYCGLTSNDYEIESGLDLTAILYSTLQQGNARRTLQDICQQALAFITVKHNGKVFIGSLIRSETTADWTLGNGDVAPIQNNQEDAANYSIVKLAYPGSGDLYSLVGKLERILLTNGENVIPVPLQSDIDIKSIEDATVDIEGNDDVQMDTGMITDISVSGSNTTAEVTVELDVQEDVYADFSVYGIINSSDIKASVTATIPGHQATDSAATYTIETNRVLNSTSAQTMAAAIASYINNLKNHLSVSASHLSPDISVGDVVEITNVSSTYNGLYYVAEVSIDISNGTYGQKMELYGIEEEEE
jgi:hypothetical protein